ncbi:MAG: cbb3-type cytochrome oxidase subunit 3 [Bacteriovoracaceae bacterium]
MKQEVLLGWDIPWLPVTALVLFVVSFSFYAWWTYRGTNRAFYEEVSRIPLEDKDRV